MAYSYEEMASRTFRESSIYIRSVVMPDEEKKPGFLDGFKSVLYGMAGHDMTDALA
jgi:hypothetical protein